MFALKTELSYSTDCDSSLGFAGVSVQKCARRERNCERVRMPLPLLSSFCSPQARSFACSHGKGWEKTRLLRTLLRRSGDRYPFHGVKMMLCIVSNFRFRKLSMVISRNNVGHGSLLNFRVLDLGRFAAKV